MVEHFNTSGHPVSFSFADFSYWCYLCDSYVVNSEVLNHTEFFYEQKFAVTDSTPAILKKIKDCKYEETIKEEDEDNQEN
mmetsp:Transcript_4572/g.4305  ORF Transcript_4572/g.4305 Transcript_4572/m.4305 type:complete len:80 (+) Transcript_4572:206-445(+)